MNPAANVVQICNVKFPEVIVAEDTRIAELELEVENLKSRMKVLQKNQQKLTGVNRSIRESLLCRYCYRNLAGPEVYSCQDGKITCGPCPCTCDGGHRNNDQVCSFVKSLSSKVLVPCQYATQGCLSLYSPTDDDALKLHEASCQHRFQCKLFLADVVDDNVAYCQWTGKRCDFLDHCLEHHKSAAIFANESVISIPIPKTSVRNNIEMRVVFIAHSDKRFLLTFHYNKEAATRSLVLDSMFLEGHEVTNEEFNVSMTFFSQDKKEKVGFVSVPREPIINELNSILVECPRLDNQMLDLFSQAESIECQVQIKRLEKIV